VCENKNNGSSDYVLPFLLPRYCTVAIVIVRFWVSLFILLFFAIGSIHTVYPED